MTTQAGYITTPSNDPLYVVRTSPNTKPKQSVVLVPPLFDERKNTAAVLRILSEKIAESERNAIRFDWRGEGESGGASKTRLPTQFREDIFTVVQSAKQDQLPFAVVGIRVGALLAADYFSEKDTPVPHKFIGLAPVISGKQQTRHWKLRSKMRSELTAKVSEEGPAEPVGAGTDFDGYDIHPDFFSEMNKLEWTPGTLSDSTPLHLIQVSHNQMLNPALDDLVNKSKAAKKSIQVIQSPPFWERLDALESQSCNAVVNAVLDLLDQEDA